MKGIILAAGAGTRLSPATLPISKILLPVYDRPMVYFPLTTLMSAGIRDILVITGESDRHNFERTLGDGSQFGVRISYMVQHVQRGISDAFIIARDFIGGDSCALVLGDNIFYGSDIERIISDAESDCSDGAVVFAHRVPDPERFGVVAFDGDGRATSLEEKPRSPKSDYAVVGLYFYDSRVCDLADTLEPSARGELEITDLNRLYLNDGSLKVRKLPDDTEWVDAGTFTSLLAAAEFVRDREVALGRKIMCPEIAAYRMGFVTRRELEEWLDRNKDNEYFRGVRAELRLAGTSSPARAR